MYNKDKEQMMQEVKQYVERYYAIFHRMPSNAEIAAEFDLNRTTVYRYLKELDRDKRITYSSKRGKTKVSTPVIDKVDMEMVSIPLVGSIPCGSPEQKEECVETYYSFPKALIGQGEFFMLVATGESMIDAGIEPGDFVIIRRQFEAKYGQIVAALVGNESTLKTLSYDEGRNMPYLHPENKNGKFKDIKERFNIQGVAVRVIKNVETSYMN